MSQENLSGHWAGESKTWTSEHSDYWGHPVVTSHQGKQLLHQDSPRIIESEED